MAWIALTEDDVLEKLTGPEVVAIQTKALGVKANGDPQEDPIPGTIDEVVREARGYVANCVRNLPMAVAPLISDKLKQSCLAIIIYRCATRLPVKILVTDERKKANDDAIRLLERVADCRFALERPTPDQLDYTEVIGTIYGSFGTRGRCRNFSPRNQDGV